MLAWVGRAAMALACRLRSGGVVVNEHTLDAAQVRQHVDVLGRWFDFIHPDDLPARLSRRGGRPFCLLTFDDGHRSNATLAAPELERLGVPACFLVVTDFVGTDGVLWFTLYSRLRRKLTDAGLPLGLRPRAVKQLPHAVRMERLLRACAEHAISLEPETEHEAAMTWDHVRELRRRGFAVGAHGVTHAVLTREAREEALASVEGSIARIVAETGAPCSGFAFPNGNYTAELAQHAHRCGARLVMTAEPTWADETSAVWRVPRVQLFEDQPRAWLEFKLAVAALGRYVPSGDGTGLVYRDVDRLARARRRAAARDPFLSPEIEPGF